MLLRNGLQPWHLLVVAVVVILVFGSKRLPDTARSLGKSLRILKSETRAMKDGGAGADGPSSSPTPSPATSEPAQRTDPGTLRATQDNPAPHRPGPP